MSGSATDGAAAKLQQVKDAFDTGWAAQSKKLGTMTSGAWHNHKALAAVKSAKWFQKSNNIGPKLDQLQAARAKLDKQVNLNNFMAVVGATGDLEKALVAFKKNREGATPQQTKDINTVVDGYAKNLSDAKGWLGGQVQQIKVLDAAELKGMLKV